MGWFLLGLVATGVCFGWLFAMLPAVGPVGWVVTVFTLYLVAYAVHLVARLIREELTWAYNRGRRHGRREAREDTRGPWSALPAAPPAVLPRARPKPPRLVRVVPTIGQSFWTWDTPYPYLGRQATVVGGSATGQPATTDAPASRGSDAPPE